MGSRRPFALVLVGPSWRDQASNVARLPEDFQRGMKARMAVRSRCTEGQLTLGTFSQHVLLGGGLDSFVSRRPTCSVAAIKSGRDPTVLTDQLARRDVERHVCRTHGQVDAQRCQICLLGSSSISAPRSGSRPSVTSRTSELIGLRPSSVPNSSTGPCAGTEPSRPGPSFSSQESGLRSLRCARLDDKDGTNPMNPKWPEQSPGGPLKC